MKKNRIYNFLMEMLIVIVFFALSMIIVVNMFAKGNILSEKTDILNKGHSTYVTVLERMKVYDGEDIDIYLDDLDIDTYGIDVSIDEYDDHYDINVSISYEDQLLNSTDVRSYRGVIYE